MEKNIIEEKSFAFAVRIVNMCNHLQGKTKNSLIDQILRSGTSIGANICEAQYAASNADFINKIQIAVKESYETEYWLKLFFATQILSQAESDSMIADCVEITKMLTAILNTTKK